MSISTKQRLYESNTHDDCRLLDEVAYEACSPRGTCDVMGSELARSGKNLGQSGKNGKFTSSGAEPRFRGERSEPRNSHEGIYKHHWRSPDYPGPPGTTLATSVYVLPPPSLPPPEWPQTNSDRQTAPSRQHDRLLLVVSHPRLITLIRTDLAWHGL